MSKRRSAKPSGSSTAKSPPKAAARAEDGLRSRLVPFLGLAMIVVIGVAMITRVNQNERASAALPFGATPLPTQTPNAAALAKRIGIISGHRGNDSGTVCSDGLTEAQVNYDHALRVAQRLRMEGFNVEILDEFDPKLDGYRAGALISIHADSCTYVNDLATGFKVARSEFATTPADEDRLVACLTDRYRAATGLRFHSNSVTHDMTRYHAFRKIADSTPASIIETGFLALDRNVLTRKADAVAKGIADGILCFARSEPV